MLYDLTHPLEEGMTYFPGDPRPTFAAWPSTPPWHVSSISAGTHSGTHIDAPSHLGTGESIDAVALERLIGRGVVIDVGHRQAGERIMVQDVETARGALESGAWPILRTGMSRFWKTESYFLHPALDHDLARAFVSWGCGLVAMDMLNPDDTQVGEALIHQTLLEAGVLIVENLAGLEALAAGKLYIFSFLPLRLAGLDGSPVRAVAWDLDHAPLSARPA